ncbi:MAG: DUF1292 domain-containing protein [Clostridiales bacterium]|jgi:uncharacterized protein YrzB (UPF0473 family)|nr:DUF1292 domain-containing protein [Clostridiales bacterium]
MENKDENKFGADKTCDCGNCESCGCGGDEFDDEEVETITLLDDDGEEREFGVIGAFDAEGKEYLAVYPLDSEDIDEDDEEIEITFYRFTQDNDEITVSPIDDEEEYQIASEAFFEFYGDDDESDFLDEDEFEDDEDDEDE